MEPFCRRIWVKMRNMGSRIFKKPAVSVIVPVYNGEKEILKCLSALLNQTTQTVRVIFVDDGSTDGTRKLLWRYKIKNPWIKILYQNNCGRAAARNKGLKAVKTKYVMFCDADDWYENDMCEKMVNAMEENDVDVAICGIRMKYEAHEEMRESDERYYALRFKGLNEIDDRIILETDGSVCNKIFRMEKIRKNGICFLGSVETAEDYYFYSTYMSVSKKAFFIERKMYNYVRHPDSIMSKNFDGKSLSDDDIQMASYLYEFYKHNGFLNKHKDLFWRQWIGSFWASYRYSGKRINKRTKQKIKKFIEDNYKKYKPADVEICKEIDEISKEIGKMRKGE